MVSPIIRSTSVLTKVGTLGIFRLMIKHWYLLIVLVVLIPNLIGAIKISMETENPSYPLVVVGLSIANADALIYADVEELKNDPNNIIGASKPEKGYWNNVVYYWHILLLIWRFTGNIFLITLPFALAYRYFKLKGQRGVQSSKGENFVSALKVGLIFIFVINLILLVVGVVDGTIMASFPADADVFQKTWGVILLTIPFHGILNLILYFIGLV